MGDFIRLFIVHDSTLPIYSHYNMSIPMERFGITMEKTTSPDRVNVSSGSPFEGPIGFSRAVRIGNVIAVSGTAPVAKDGSTAFVGDAYRQTKRCLEIIQKAIENAGGELRNTIRTRVFLTDISKWTEVGRAHGEFFGDIRPACTFVEAKGLISGDWLVEIEADCILD